MRLKYKADLPLLVTWLFYLPKQGITMNIKRGKVKTFCIQATFLIGSLFLHSQVIFATANYFGSITIDSTGAVGQYTAIALDSLDTVHISYYDSTNTALKYATNASGAWAIETVDNTGAVGQYAAVALDSLDTVHISYYDSTNTALKYATNASGTWIIETVDNTGVVGQHTSISLDFANNVHLSYYDGGWCLKYSTNANGSWETIRAESIYIAGQYSSIVIDAAGNGYISYWNSGDLKLSFVGQIDLAVSPQSIILGLNNPAQQLFTAKNTGNTAISLGELVVTSVYPDTFKIVSNDCSFANLLSNETCQFLVSYYIRQGHTYATIVIPVTSMGSETIYIPLKGYFDFPDWLSDSG